MSGQRAKKSLGQNFLVDPNQQRRIVEALDARPDDTIIEIGPGRGALTRHLVDAVSRLILIELDRELAPALAREFADRPNVTVIEGNVLDIDLPDIAGTDPHRVKVVGNIPYNITTPIIFHLLRRDARPERIVLMVQREVADRIVAPPGDAEYGALSVGVRSVARVERLFHVARGSFRPVPRVDSSVIRITPIRPPPLTAQDEEDLRELTRVAFSWRRKQLQKTLRSAESYRLDAHAITQLEQRTGISLELRPEQLDPDQFIALARSIRQLRSAGTGSAHRAIEEWNAVLGHELRSPIAAILGYQELIAEGTFGDVADGARDSLLRIGLAAQQLLLLVEAIERSGGSAPPVEPVRSIPATSLCRDAVEQVRFEAESRSTIIDIDESDVVLLTRPADAIRALVLVLGAAIKASPGDTLRLSIRDDAVPRITVAGAALDPARDTAAPGVPLTGAALRLDLARSAARHAGGSIELDSSGSVHLTLPPPS
ncbi:MAG TPA: 16S rRNA (adenine(1518)-N(6)/adenine(1519)-N(6))-dimethyltransferase RsmA [Longimicrobiales bacterium]